MSDFNWDELPTVPAEKASTSGSGEFKWEDYPTETQAPGQGEATLRGASQGLSMGFGDEIYGGGSAAIQSLLESLKMAKDDGKSFSEKYTDERDEVRKNNAAAQEANPWTYGAADLAGSIAPMVVTGGSGLVGKGLTKAGLEFAAKEGGKVGLEKALAGGSLKALTALGFAEGAVQGLGRSDATDAKGIATDVAIGTGLGVAAPIALKGAGSAIKGTGRLADTALTKLDDAVGGMTGYGHLKDVASEGYQNVGQKLKDVAIAARDKLGLSADELKNQRIVQDSQYKADLAAAQEAVGNKVKGSVQNLKDITKQHIGAKSQEIGLNNQALNDAIKQNIEPTGLGMVGDELKGTRLNFNDVADQFRGTKEYLEGKDIKILDKIENDINKGDYFTFDERLKDLKALISSNEGQPAERHLLNLKDQLEQSMDQQVKSLPESVQNLFGQKKSLDKDYGLLKSVQNPTSGNLGATNNVEDAILGLKASSRAEPGNLFGLDTKEAMSKAYQTGSPQMTEAADQLVDAGAQHNKFVMHPEKGQMFTSEMGPQTVAGQNEMLSKQGEDVFGLAKDNGFTSSFVNTVSDINIPQENIGPASKQNELIDWIKTTYGNKADDMISQLKEESKKYNLLKANLSAKDDFSSTTHGVLRFLKKIADPLSFGAGQTTSKFSQGLNKAAEKGLNPSIGTRAIAPVIKPVSTFVEQFKRSQTQGVEPETE